jgi:phage tail sheath gpL-like
MATANHVLVVTSDRLWVWDNLRPKHFIQKFLWFLQGMAAGVIGSKPNNAMSWRSDAVKATGTITLADAAADAGAYTATINGVVSTLAAGTAGDASGTLSGLKAAIVGNADAKVAKHVSVAGPTATVAGTYKLTITALMPGHSGNAITLACAGTGAAASGARLTGGTEDAAVNTTF